MDNKFAILCMPDDFYLGDALCRELEKNGRKCLFNLRDAVNPLAPNFRNFTNVDILIAIVCKEFVSNKSLVKIVESHTNIPLDSDKMYLLASDDIEIFPTQWEDCYLLDARKGLDKSIIEKVLDSKKCLESEKVNPKKSQNSKPEVSTGQDRRHSADSTNKTVGTVSDPVSIQQNENMSQTKVEPYNPLLNLRTVMTPIPKVNYDDELAERIDLTTEAWLVPLYILPFERGEKIVDLSLLYTIEPSTSTLTRDLKYALGDGVPKSEERAYTLIKKALSENDSDPMINYAMGVFLECGVGCKTDGEAALKFYTIAADNGLEMALFRKALWTYYLTKKSEDLIEIATALHQQGDLEASFALGVVAEDNGDYEDAIEYYSEAAELGNQKAQNALACMYYNGKGVSVNQQTAIEWANIAAQNGLLVAQWNILLDDMNNIERSLPERSDLNNIIDFLQKYNRYIFFVSEYIHAVRYNIGILMLRSVYMHIDTIASWMGQCPYYNRFFEEFKRLHNQEVDRRDRDAALTSAGNAIGSLLAGINGSHWNKHGRKYYVRGDNGKEKKL